MNPAQIRSKVDELLQQSPFAGINDDLKLLLQSQINSLLSKANLVTREEFDVQVEALRRTQAKLVELEDKLKQLT
jgi:BMFP domain-containing protein YqiC